ncbi:MAG: 3'-5' exoribonuclease YhaM family protein, partial [Anaerolineales bacterium]
MEAQHPLKGTFVADLRVGERVVAFFLVRGKQLEPFRDRSKGEYLTLVLADRSGQVLARVWEGAPELAENFVEGDVVKVAADVEEYLGRTQLIVQKLRQAEADEYDLADFLPATQKNVGEMLADVQAALDGIQNPHLTALVRHFYEAPDFRDRLAQAPAARRVHHAYLGGLLEHLTEMLALSSTVLTLYPEINADLLRTGVLLQEVGRLREYSWSGDIDYTDEGRLLGDIVLGDEQVARAIAQIPGFPEELA